MENIGEASGQYSQENLKLPRMLLTKRFCPLVCWELSSGDLQAEVLARLLQGRKRICAD